MRGLTNLPLKPRREKIREPKLCSSFGVGLEKRWNTKTPRNKLLANTSLNSRAQTLSSGKEFVEAAFVAIKISSMHDQ